LDERQNSHDHEQRKIENDFRKRAGTILAILLMRVMVMKAKGIHRYPCPDQKDDAPEQPACIAYDNFLVHGNAY